MTATPRRDTVSGHTLHGLIDLLCGAPDTAPLLHLFNLDSPQHVYSKLLQLTHILPFIQWLIKLKNYNTRVAYGNVSLRHPVHLSSSASSLFLLIFSPCVTFIGCHLHILLISRGRCLLLTLTPAAGLREGRKVIAIRAAAEESGQVIVRFCHPSPAACFSLSVSLCFHWFPFDLRACLLSRLVCLRQYVECSYI